MQKIILHSDHGVNFMSNTRELLVRKGKNDFFCMKIAKYDIKQIKEIRELPSMICSDLNIVII